jgi:hypothetical protein
VLAATYYQVWWPSTQTVTYDGDHLPIWDETSATYLDPGTGEVLPTWDEALGAIDQDEPQHVVRFGLLGISATDPHRYTWEPVKPGDPDHMPNGQRLLHVVADRTQWQTALEQARRRTATSVEPDSEAPGRAASAAPTPPDRARNGHAAVSTHPEDRQLSP